MNRIEITNKGALNSLITKFRDKKYKGEALRKIYSELGKMYGIELLDSLPHKNVMIKTPFEYSYSAEPQFRCGVSHLSGTTEPPASF